MGTLLSVLGTQHSLSLVTEKAAFSCSLCPEHRPGLSCPAFKALSQCLVTLATSVWSCWGMGDHYQKVSCQAVLFLGVGPGT